MFARQQKQRRLLIYKKAQEKKERIKLEKKLQVKKSLEENKVLPTTVQTEALKIQESLEWDDVAAENPNAEFDDEYRWALVEDPKIVITTSHDPSSRLKKFAKEMKLIFPNSQRMNRGNLNIKTLVGACQANGVTDIVIIEETRGVPDCLTVCHLPHGPTAKFHMSSTIMRHDIPDVETMPQEFPHLAFYNFKTKLGNRVMSILKHLFPVPKEKSKRIYSFFNVDDCIFFRNHSYSTDGKAEIQLIEDGPRFVLRLFEIRQGTLDFYNTADVEWTLHNFRRTGRKRKFLSEDPL